MSSLSRAVSLLLLAGAVAATCSPPPNEPAHPARPANAAPEAGTPLDSSADVGATGSGDASVDAADEPPGEPVVPASLADSVNAFARDLHRVLSAKEKGNLIHSPLSSVEDRAEPIGDRATRSSTALRSPIPCKSRHRRMFMCEWFRAGPNVSKVAARC